MADIYLFKRIVNRLWNIGVPTVLAWYESGNTDGGVYIQPLDWCGN
jgi:hypothetical protein